MRCHLAENNYASALRVYRNFRAHLQRELGVEPSAHFAELLGLDSLNGDPRLLVRALRTS
ncbi:BTAD domain-containing putative transcriptional regulator [Cryobacterium sp. Y11]|uniref:BTAD domain-containing putative transcriptional regulator n=1 Tax=Cryobacterium sp. Y11 TaxID=2045016 RepID=UPI00351418F4